MFFPGSVFPRFKKNPYKIQALAYIANKFGFDVKDYRGGRSRSFFADNPTLELLTKSGGFKVSGTNGFKNAESLLQHVEKGKEYLFTSGEHAVIIRLKGNIRQRQKLFEFLELQDSSKDGNGFQELTEPILKSRFFTKVGRKECVDFLIDIEKIKDSPKFRELLGYLNTQGP